MNLKKDAGIAALFLYYILGLSEAKQTGLL